MRLSLAPRLALRNWNRMPEEREVDVAGQTDGLAVETKVSPRACDFSDSAQAVQHRSLIGSLHSSYC